MVSELRPRAASNNRDPSTSAALLLPQYVDAAPPHSSSQSPLRRWKRLLLGGFVLYTSFLLVWLVYMGRRRGSGGVAGSLEDFISTTNLDESKLQFLYSHEDPELRSDFPFAELEMEFLHQNDASINRDQNEMAEADAYAKTLKPFPVSETKIRRLRCIGWRATDNCDPRGPRLPSLDEPCNKIIPFGASGYCEVQDKDTGESFRVMHRYCSSVRDTARFRCSESWDFANFPLKAREALAKARKDSAMLPNIAPIPANQQEPRDGIVMVVYPKLLASTYATIRALRDVLGCQLPVELWFRSQEMKLFPEAFGHLQQWSRENNVNVSFREISEHTVTGFATKVFAIYNSFFERVLFLDADNVPVHDPSFLFDSAEFEETGAVFWPDFWHPGDSIFNIQPHSLLWELLDLPFVSMFEQESGQLLVNRRRHTAPLELVKFYTFHRPNHFDKMKLAHGDKDLFRFAWLKLGAPFHMIESPPAVAGKIVNGSFCGMTMVQHDAQGEVLFLHRNSHKLMGTPRRKAVNMKAAAIRRARNKRLRMKMAEADRITLGGSEAERAALEDTPSPTLEAPEPDGYPDMAIWTHLVSLKNSSRRSDYRIKTYNADPDFEKGQNCYGHRYLNQSKHFVTQEFANLSYAGLETDLRRFAQEGARFYKQAGIMGR